LEGLKFGIASEAFFTLKEGRPVTSAVFVTCLIFSLSLPPTVPVWMALIGIMAVVIFGKMIFDGFGQNVFNQAMVGRCFIYTAFPSALTNNWVEPSWYGLSTIRHAAYTLFSGAFLFSYAFVLTIISVVRETPGFGTILGIRVMPAGFTPWTIMIVAPGAFFVLGVFTWMVRACVPFSPFQGRYAK